MDRDRELSSLDLKHIVNVNEHIKQVLNIAEESHLAAINAMLVTKSVGNGLKGFAVIASELQYFSHRLAEIMNELEGIVFRLIRHVSQLRKLLREQGVMDKTVRNNDETGQWLSGAITRKQARIDALMQVYQQDMHNFRRQIQVGQRQCKNISTLPHNAKIEAAYGNEVSHLLTQISAQIDQTLQQILAILQTISQLTETQR